MHDFAGHAFPVQLSRALAGRGFEVLHVYCSSFTSGHGPLDGDSSDPAALAISGIALSRKFSRYSVAARFRDEWSYSKLFEEEVIRFRPHVILDSNPALLAKLRIANRLKRRHIPWIYWLQDIASVAMGDELERRFGRMGHALGRLPVAIEGRLLRDAAAVISITPDFSPYLEQWGVPAEDQHVIPNWGPVNEIHPRARDERWLQGHGIHGAKVVLYAGTLGLKHNPATLLDVAAALEPLQADLVVASEGTGADFLRARLDDHSNMHILPYQPYEEFGAMLAASDVTLAILNDAAGAFSVPSKILAYLCAGRPVVASVPEANQVARVLSESGAGLVVAPGDGRALGAAAVQLVRDDQRRADMGAAGRAYAEAKFGIDRIADQFAEILVRTAPRAPGRRV